MSETIIVIEPPMQRPNIIVNSLGEGQLFFIIWFFKSIFSLNFIVLFPYLINYYNIMFIIVVWLGCDMPSGLLFFRARFTSFLTNASLLTFFICFCILFHSCCSRPEVFGKTLVHLFPISHSHTEWYLFFSDSVTTSTHFAVGTKK